MERIQLDQLSPQAPLVAPKLELHLLEQKIADLKNLCLTIDPYSPLNDQDKELLNRYQIYDFYDPFMLTNKLILALEDALEEWHQRTNTPLE